MKAMAIGIHTDDTDASVGGTCALLAQRGWDVTFVQLRPNIFDPDPEANNARSIAASKILGVKKIILDDPRRISFRNNDETILALRDVICDEKPDVMFVMHPKDNHIAHVECSKTARNAIVAASVKGVSPNEIYSYETGPLQSMCYFVPDAYICINGIEDKLEACLRAFFSNKPEAGEHLWREKEVAMALRGHEGCNSKDELNSLYGEYDSQALQKKAYAEGLMLIKLPQGNNDFLLRQALHDRFSWGGNNMYFPVGGRIGWND